MCVFVCSHCSICGAVAFIFFQEPVRVSIAMKEQCDRSVINQPVRTGDLSVQNVAAV